MIADILTKACSRAVFAALIAFTWLVVHTGKTHAITTGPDTAAFERDLVALAPLWRDATFDRAAKLLGVFVGDGWSGAQLGALGAR